MAKPYRVLFVCMGNICRSPIAEAVARTLAQQQGLGRDLDFDSAGTHGHYHAGEAPDPRARIGRLAGVIVTVRAGRIEIQVAAQTLLLRQGASDCLGDRRAADVAHADEKNPVRLGHTISPDQLLDDRR